MSLELWRPLLIDRISMNLEIDKNDLYSFAWEQLRGIHDLQKQLLPEGKITLKKEQYATRIGYYPNKKRKIADIELGQAYQHRYLKLTLYPPKFAGNEFAELKELLGILLPEFRYENFFLHSRVAYIELACDSLTHPAHSFIPFRAKSNNSLIFVDGLGGKGSTYLGSTTSYLPFCIYDKAKQLKESKQTVPYKVHTRLESRVRKLNLPPVELSLKMLNPFEKLWIADVSLARSLWTDTHWLSFLDSCENIGSAASLAKMPKASRKVFMSRLFMARAKWWRPHDHWKGIESALTKIAP